MWVYIDNLINTCAFISFCCCSRLVCPSRSCGQRQTRGNFQYCAVILINDLYYSPFYTRCFALCVSLCIVRGHFLSISLINAPRAAKRLGFRFSLSWLWICDVLITRRVASSDFIFVALALIGPIHSINFTARSAACDIDATPRWSMRNAPRSILLFADKFSRKNRTYTHRMPSDMGDDRQEHQRHQSKQNGTSIHFFFSFLAPLCSVFSRLFHVRIGLRLASIASRETNVRTKCVYAVRLTL